jgi:membrane protein DedA with SNARE-associated domain
VASTVWVKVFSVLAFLLADAASEGLSVILWMLGTGCVFLAVIAIGELTHWAGARRKARRRVQY